MEIVEVRLVLHHYKTFYFNFILIIQKIHQHSVNVTAWVEGLVNGTRDVTVLATTSQDSATWTPLQSYIHVGALMNMDSRMVLTDSLLPA